MMMIMTEIGMITRVREKHVSRGVSRAPSQGAGPESPPNYWDLHARTQYEKHCMQFCTAIKLHVGNKKLQGRPRMLTRDLFAIANLVLTLNAHQQNGMSEINVCISMFIFPCPRIVFQLLLSSM